MDAPYTRDQNADCVAEIVFYGASHRIVRDNPTTLLVAVKAAKSLRNAIALLLTVLAAALLVIILTHVGNRDPFSFALMFASAFNLRKFIRGAVINMLIAWRWRQFARTLQLYLFAKESAQRKAQQ